MADKGGLYHFTNNATVAAVIGVIVGGLVGYIAKDIQVHDAVTYNNISSYIESMLVEPGYVSEEVLDKETPFKQIEFIGQDVSSKLKESNDKSDKMMGSVQAFLLSCGDDEKSINKMEIDDLVKALEKKSSDFISLKADLEKAEGKNSEYEKLTLAELKTPSAIILGEQYSEPTQNYQAVINGHNYYSEDFLNSFLDYDFVYENETIYYHKGSPERVKISEKVIYDQSGDISVLTGDEKKTMELEEYNQGIEFYGHESGELKISCKKEYSAIEFKIGHIDNGTRSGKDISVSYQDDQGKYIVAEKIGCTYDMAVQSYVIPIFNTQTIMISTERTGYPNDGNYLLADVYLIK